MVSGVEREGLRRCERRGSGFDSRRTPLTGVCSCVFFQAEDGIRDLTVTGVQTCALPISDRWDRRRTMIVSDIVRGAVLVPVAVAGLAGDLPLWGLVLAAFALTTATSYFAPA